MKMSRVATHCADYTKAASLPPIFSPLSYASPQYLTLIVTMIISSSSLVFVYFQFHSILIIHLCNLYASPQHIIPFLKIMLITNFYRDIRLQR